MNGRVLSLALGIGGGILGAEVLTSIFDGDSLGDDRQYDDGYQAGFAAVSLTPSSTAERHNVTYNTANDAFGKLERMGILSEITGAKYGRIFVCPKVRRIVTRP
jgi:hypothetical protein